MDYEEYEKKCNDIRQENDKLLGEFAAKLQEKGLSQKTIKKHQKNINFYINVYLLHTEPQLPEEGASGFLVDDFLGYFLIKKCMWGTKETTKAYCAGLKKFYKFMLDKGRIDKIDYQELKDTIKERKSLWLKEMEDWLNFDPEW